MVEHFELKDYPYEERRMDFFKQKRLEAERRVKHWQKRAVNGAYNSIQHEKVCDAVDELSFYTDVIEMLERRKGECQVADLLVKKNYDLTEITRLLLKLRDNCVPKEGDAYEDPERAEKYDALNAAIDLINNPSLLDK